MIAVMQQEVLERCQAVFPSWQGLTTDDFEFDDPKGFSSFTMGIRSKRNVDPPAVLYRHLDGKENAILDFATERETFLLLGEHHIAAHCHHYDDTCRIEQFYVGRTLVADDLFIADTQRKIADELYRMHQLEPANLPAKTFFELLHEQWGSMARSVLGEHRSAFPPDEQAMCDELQAIYQDDTIAKVLRCLPNRPPVFCHNDTYHGNVFLLDDGSIRLLDFEFSCRNHIAFDFANLFAETVMEHGLDRPASLPHRRAPHSPIDDLRDLVHRLLSRQRPTFGMPGIGRRRGRAAGWWARPAERSCCRTTCTPWPRCHLALEPIQKIRFIPYAHQRFHKFLAAWEAEFGDEE